MFAHDQIKIFKYLCLHCFMTFNFTLHYLDIQLKDSWYGPSLLILSSSPYFCLHLTYLLHVYHQSHVCTKVCRLLVFGNQNYISRKCDYSVPIYHYLHIQHHKPSLYLSCFISYNCGQENEYLIVQVIRFLQRNWPGVKSCLGLALHSGSMGAMALTSVSFVSLMIWKYNTVLFVELL